MVFEHDYNKFPELTNTQIQDFGFSSPHKQITEDFRATVIKVTDGDTITVRTTFRDFDFPVRFLNINSPELNEGGEESKKWLTNQILNANVDVLINSDNRVGKYGRLLGTIIYNGQDVGQEEIHLGLAKPFDQRNEGKIDTAEKTFNLKQWF